MKSKSAGTGRPLPSKAGGTGHSSECPVPFFDGLAPEGMGVPAYPRSARCIREAM